MAGAGGLVSAMLDRWYRTLRLLGMLVEIALIAGLFALAWLEWTAGHAR